MSANQRYVTEAVWLPTYIGVFLLLIGAFGVGSFGILVTLIASRALLELTYRIVFGEQRHELRTKVIAFVSQLLLWGFVWARHAQNSASNQS